MPEQPYNKIAFTLRPYRIPAKLSIDKAEQIAIALEGMSLAWKNGQDHAEINGVDVTTMVPPGWNPLLCATALAAMVKEHPEVTNAHPALLKWAEPDAVKKLDDEYLGREHAGWGCRWIESQQEKQDA